MNVKALYRLLNRLFKLNVVIVVAALLITSTAAAPAMANKGDEHRPEKTIPDALIEPGPGPGRYILVVEKSEQRLDLYEFRMGHYYKLRSMPCSTGENTGDKNIEGDKKTPEGFYLFNKKSLESELAPIYGILAYPMDYPNFWDRHIGKQGSGIWLHGTNKKLKPLDSNGCVELKNIDILHLEDLLHLYDTPIVVYDQIAYKSIDEINSEAARIKAFVESWRISWEKKDLKSYKSKYSRDFISDDGKNYDRWLEHKEQLAEKYSRIRVDLANLRIYRHQGVIVVLFEQYYQGDGFKSDGLKRLFIRETEGGYKIVAEAWSEFPPRSPEKVLSAEVRQRVLKDAGHTASMTASLDKPAPQPVRPEIPAVQPAPAPVPKPTRVTVAAKTPAAAPTVIPPAPTAPLPPTSAALPPETRKAVQSPEELRNIRNVFADWLDAWRSMNVESYLNYYHPQFTFKGMDLQEFKTYKEDLVKKYKDISIKVSKLNIEIEGSTAKVTFIQDYKSDKYQDYGLKTLYLQKHNQDWRIRKEIWQDMSAGAKP